jgi:YbgC/YbaW family acyl-CoA thioester hydrolase
MAASVARAFTVGWGDCAPSGAVYYPNYFRWFDQSVWDLFAAAGMPILELERRYGIMGVPLAQLSCSFLKPCRLGDAVQVETRIAAIDGKAIRIEHMVAGEDGPLVTARDERFWGVRRDGRLRREAVPAEVAERLLR